MWPDPVPAERLASVDKVRSAWREDRRECGAFLLLLVAAVLAISTAHDPFSWTYAVAVPFLAVWEAIAILVVRPRRLARTGRRSKPGWWNP